MYYAIIDSASLINPTILNNYEHKKVTVQFEPQSTTSKYHYNFVLQFSDNVVDQAIADIQKEMLKSWYSFFWDEKTLNIVFDTKKFTVELPDGWSSDQIKKAQEFGKSQNISEGYLDFKVYFKPYEAMVRKLTK